MIVEEYFDESSLKATINESIPDLIDADLPAIADRFASEMMGDSLGLAPGDLWQAFKSEMYLLVCTDDAKYKALREAAARHTKKSQVPLLSTIAVFVGSEIGVEAGLLSPYVALFFAWSMKVGKESACRAIGGS